MVLSIFLFNFINKDYKILLAFQSFNIFIMYQIDPILSERKKKKSISQLEYSPNYNFNNVNNLYHESNRQQHLSDYEKQYINNSRERKKSIIKINKRKLPLDFFISDRAEQLIKKTIDAKEKPRKDFHSNQPLNQKKIFSMKFIQYQSNDDKKDSHKIQQRQSDELKNTCFFGNFNPPQIKPLAVQSKVLPQKNIYQRNYQTRSEQKREKIDIEPRKFTAVNHSHKPDVLELLPAYKQRLEGQINDMIVFTGTFARQFKNIQGRTSPIKQMLTPIKQKIQKKNSMDNRQKYFHLKLNTNLKSTEESQKQIFSPPLKSEKQIIDSPLKKSKEIVAKKQKELSSPVKLISNYPQNYNGFDSSQKIKSKKLNEIPLNSNNQNLTNQQMNITFANNKSTILPPIVPNNISIK